MKRFLLALCAVLLALGISWADDAVSSSMKASMNSRSSLAPPEPTLYLKVEGVETTAHNGGEACKVTAYVSSDMRWIFSFAVDAENSMLGHTIYRLVPVEWEVVRKYPDPPIVGFRQYEVETTYVVTDLGTGEVIKVLGR